MKTGTIKYSQEFKLIDGSSKWWGIELEYDMDSEEPLDVAERARSLVYKFAQPQSGQVAIDNSIPPGPPPIIQVSPGDREIGVSVEIIMSCKDLTTLHTYKFIVRGCSKEIREAYQERERELMSNIQMGY